MTQRSRGGGRWRVHELAFEFGIPTRDLLALLKDMGEFTRSASSVLDEAVVRKLRQDLGESRPPSISRTSKLPRPNPFEQVSPAAGLRQVAPREAQHAAAPLPTSTRPSVPELPPLLDDVGLPDHAVRFHDEQDYFQAVVAIDQFMSGGPTARAQPHDNLLPSPAGRAFTDPGYVRGSNARKAAADWTTRAISRDRRQRWLDAGLGPTDSKIAQECERVGITPEMLAQKVDGRRLCESLLDGVPAHSLVQRLQAHGSQTG